MEEYNPLSAPAEPPGEFHDRQMFRILRNIDLNLLTIFEAVYVHRGIVNAAKVLNITPSAISQSLNKLRSVFPDPLFIRKGQGVMPTAFATQLHLHVSTGMEAFLNALDFTADPAQQRVLTIATSPDVGTMVIPVIARALKATHPQVLLHNIAINDAESQLNRRQVDLLIDSAIHSGQALTYDELFQDRLLLMCREGHPALDLPATAENLRPYEHALVRPGIRYPAIQRRLRESLGERREGFSSYSLIPIAAMISESDLLGLVPSRLYTLLARIWPLRTLDYLPLREERITISLHYHKLSAREPLLKEIIQIIRQAF